MTRSLQRKGWFLAGLMLILAFGVYRVGDRRIQWREHRFDPLFEDVARRSGIPPTLLKAVAWRESRFQPAARGRHGELGLMQLTEGAAQEWADAVGHETFVHEHVLDPATNVVAAAHYLGKLVRRYTETDHPWVYALADYNAGRANVVRWMEGEARTNSQQFLSGMTFPGTRRYVEAVLERNDLYEREAWVTGRAGWMSDQTLQEGPP
jgi:soluble lytic murein transglycosylase